MARKSIYKKKNDIYCCYNIEGAVFRVQGPLPNLEICQNINRKLQKE